MHIRLVSTASQEKDFSARISAVERKRIERFFKNLGSTIVASIFEAPEILGIVVLALVCVGIVWCIGVLVHDLVLDPHVITAATLDSLSINPDKWIIRGR